MDDSLTRGACRRGRGGHCTRYWIYWAFHSKKREFFSDASSRALGNISESIAGK